MIRNEITETYLRMLENRGVDPTAITDYLAQRVDLAGTVYQGRALSRPVFLSESERAGLLHDLTTLRNALATLPDRLFGGDLVAFARAVGLSARQAEVVASCGRPPLSQLTRADIYHEPAGFRLMELNIGSPVGGLDNALLNQALADHPLVDEFMNEHKLGYLDTLAAAMATMRIEAGIASHARPLVAAVDSPDSFAALEPLLRRSAEALDRYGVEAIACHLGQLRCHGGRVWLDDRPVDAIYRIFILENLRDPALVSLIDPLLAAVARGEVAMFTPIDTDLYGNKVALAMLSDEANRHLFSPLELASLDRLLPWTRMVRDEPVTVDGERVSLREYVLAHREQLVLKPASLYGGRGFVMGSQVDDEQWRQAVCVAMEQPYVVQRRLAGLPEPFPGPTGLEQWLLRWGVFTAAPSQATTQDGFAGAMVIGSRDLSGRVLNVSGGATAGCCFHAGEPTSA